LQECEPGPFGCAIVPPPIALYDTIEACCAVGQSWVNFDYCTSRSVGEYSNGWVVDYKHEKCAKDCNPDEGPHCSDPGHNDLSATIFVTPQECCGALLGWVDLDSCVAYSENDESGNGGEGSLEPSNKFFADYQSGSCLQECEPGPFGCAIVPPPIALYDTIEACCAVGQSWVNFDYCTSRSVGEYSNGWVVDYKHEKCAKDCNPDEGPHCSDPGHNDLSSAIFPTPKECCGALLGWIDLGSCVAVSKNSASN